MRVVGHRRPKSEARNAIGWGTFRVDRAALFAASGLPGLLDNQAEFDYFLMHGYVPMPDESASSSAFDVDELDEAQRAALSELILCYVDAFGDPGVSGLIALLASDAR
jgi:hypothetical protein